MVGGGPGGQQPCVPRSLLSLSSDTGRELSSPWSPRRPPRPDIAEPHIPVQVNGLPMLLGNCLSGKQILQLISLKINPQIKCRLRSLAHQARSASPASPARTHLPPPRAAVCSGAGCAQLPPFLRPTSALASMSSVSSESFLISQAESTTPTFVVS